MILSVKNLSVAFGGLKAVEDFSLELGDNELVGLIGPNGAGKPLYSMCLQESMLLRKVNFP